MRGRQAGFTVLELMIAVTILAVVTGGAVLALSASQRSFNQMVANGVVNTDINRATNRIAQLAVGARETTLITSPEQDGVSFQRAAGWVDGNATWTGDVDIALEYEPNEFDNGVDDDGDGFIDECQVVLTENFGQIDERRVVLVNGVREFLEGELPDGVDNNGNGIEDERGLCFEIQDDALVIRLTLLGLQPEGGVTLRTLETVVGLRN